FAEYRDTVEYLKGNLEGLLKAGSKPFSGRPRKRKCPKGSREKPSLSSERGEFNPLVSTCIGEEGADIPLHQSGSFLRTRPSSHQKDPKERQDR
ncbi:hypothetical protein AKJ41_06515, partial [candidate division MSBL1 archaeon SCGC-AAA259O05]